MQDTSLRSKMDTFLSLINFSKILLLFSPKKEKLLFCKIADDGVGRKRAAELNTKSSLTYKSMGMRITADRIAILQQQEQNKTFISVKDLVLPDGRPAGTEVLIKVPVSYD